MRISDWSSDVCSSDLEYGSGILSVDPWLLGFLLGDGGLCSGCIGFTSADAELVERVRAAVPPCQTVYQVSKYNYRITSGRSGGKQNVLKKALRSLGVYGVCGEKKSIPLKYLNASLGERIELDRKKVV